MKYYNCKERSKNMSSDKKQNVAKHVGIVFVLSITTSILSFVCELLFANYFGVSSQTDAFTIASQIPNVLFSVVTASISTTVIPIYSKLLYKGDSHDATKFISRFSTLILIISIIFVVLGELFASTIVKIFSPGITTETHAHAVDFIRILFPVVVFTAMMSILMGVLQTHKKFNRSGFLTVIRQIVYALMMFLLHQVWGIYAAVFGILIAATAEGFAAYLFALRTEKIRPDFRLRDENVLTAIRMSAPIFLGIGAAEINNLVDKVVASFFESGSISLLNYASKLSGAFTSLIIGSISTVMFPYFAELSAKEDKAGLSKVFASTLKVYAFLTIPIIVGGVLLRQNLVEIAFLRGAFTKENATDVAILFAGYLLSMLFSAFRQVGAKLFYATGDTKTPMINTVIGIVLNIVLNIVLGYFLGTLGLVLATVISTAVIATLLLISSHKLIDSGIWKPFFLSLIKTAVAAAVMGLAIFLIMPFLSGINNIISTVALVLIGAVVYGILLLVLNRKDIKELIAVVRKR